MTETQCGAVRELVPDFVGGRLAEREFRLVERHIAECEECRAETGLARVILASRPGVPTALGVPTVTSSNVSPSSSPAPQIEAPCHSHGDCPCQLRYSVNDAPR